MNTPERLRSVAVSTDGGLAVAMLLRRTGVKPNVPTSACVVGSDGYRTRATRAYSNGLAAFLRASGAE